MLGVLQILSYSVFLIALWGTHGYPHFMDEETGFKKLSHLSKVPGNKWQS